MTRICLKAAAPPGQARCSSDCPFRRGREKHHIGLEDSGHDIEYKVQSWASIATTRQHTTASVTCYVNYGRWLRPSELKRSVDTVFGDNCCSALSLIAAIVVACAQLWKAGPIRCKNTANENLSVIQLKSKYLIGGLMTLG